LGRRFDSPSLSLNASPALWWLGEAPPQCFGLGSAADEELVLLHGVQAYLKAICQDGLGLLPSLWGRLAVWVGWRNSRSCGRPVVRVVRVSALQPGSAASVSLVRAGGRVQQGLEKRAASRLGLVNSALGVVGLAALAPVSAGLGERVPLWASAQGFRFFRRLLEVIPEVSGPRQLPG